MPSGRRGRSSPHRGLGRGPRGDHRASGVRAAPSHLEARRERNGAERGQAALRTSGE